jgi:flagellar motor switch protein FliN/FliY
VAAENDNPLSPDQLDELLASVEGAAPGQSPTGSPSSTGIGKDAAGRRFGGDSAAAADPTERLLDQAEADLAAAIAPNLAPGIAGGMDLSDAAQLNLPQFGDASHVDAEESARLETLQDVELDLRIELGRTELLIDEVLRLKEGSVVPLDKLAGDPVDILVNGRLVARGEVLVLNDNFCVRVAEILTPDF